MERKRLLKKNNKSTKFLKSSLVTESFDNEEVSMSINDGKIDMQ